MSRYKFLNSTKDHMNSNGNRLFSIDFLGCGGAFDIGEGNSSVILETSNKNRFLIDCGYTAYKKLKERDLVSSIDRVFITRLHEDHISGLSTLVYDNFLLNSKVTIIECSIEVSTGLKSYLELTGHSEDMYVINTDNPVIDIDNLSITKIDTSDHHWSENNLPNSGLLFNFDLSGDYVVFIYSGDINKSILDVIPESVKNDLEKNPDKVFICHDMTDIVNEKNPHTNNSLLDTNHECLIDMASKFTNLITYHHNIDQLSNIIKLNPEIAKTSIIFKGPRLSVSKVNESIS